MKKGFIKDCLFFKGDKYDRTIGLMTWLASMALIWTSTIICSLITMYKSIA